MYSRLIVPLDGTEGAESVLPYVAQLPGESVALLVCLPGYDDMLSFVDRAAAEAERRRLRDDAVAYLERVAPILERTGKQVEHWIELGEPAARILDEATASDLVVMTTHGFGAGRRAVFGSVADRVVRHAAAPVMVVREGDTPVPEKPIGRIVVPLDGSERAEAAIPLARTIASALGIPVRLIRALDMNLLNEAIRAGTYASAAFAASRHDVRAAIQRYLDEQAGTFSSAGVSVETALLDGSAANALIDNVDPSDLIVMTSHGRGGVKHWLLGSVAEKLVRLAPAPVLVCR